MRAKDRLFFQVPEDHSHVLPYSSYLPRPGHILTFQLPSLCSLSPICSAFSKAQVVLVRIRSKLKGQEDKNGRAFIIQKAENHVIKI